MSASGLGAFEGQRVWAAAVQPEDSPHNATVTVLLQTTVQDGAFDVMCPDSLEEQYYYPSYVAVIDADGSGNCSADDQFVLGQFYGWNEDVVGVIDSTEWFESIGDTTTWGEKGFCEYYVPDALLK